MSDRQVRVEAIIREAVFMTKPSKQMRPVSGIAGELSPPPRFSRKTSASGLDETYYNTRSGVLNATQPVAPGKVRGNNYIHILRLKKLRAADHAFTEPSSLLSIKSALSLASSRINSPLGSPARVFALPKSFESSAIECCCDPATRCTCGKRAFAPPPAKWLGDLTAKCKVMTETTKAYRAQIDRQKQYVQDRLRLFSREANLALRSQERDARFQVRRRMHEVSKRLLANEVV